MQLFHYEISLCFSPKTYNKCVLFNPFPFFVLPNENNQSIKAKKKEKERKNEKRKKQQTNKQRMKGGEGGTNALLQENVQILPYAAPIYQILNEISYNVKSKHIIRNT
jgi:hypothetical protein